jgi:lipoprotein signal peptidase
MTYKSLTLTTLLLLVLDQGTKKYIITQNFPHQQNPSLFFLNTPLPFLVALSAIFLFILFIWLIKTAKQKNHSLTIALSLIFIGGLSNFYNRLISGYVIDWIFLPLFPFSVLNLADLYITTGLLLAFFPLKNQNKHRFQHSGKIKI